MKSKLLHTILMFLVVGGLLFILAQSIFPFAKERPLKGYIAPIEKAEFSLETWWSGEYQEQEESYLTSNFGFRNFFLKLDHQISWSAFKSAHANGVVVGKNDFLYEKNYIDAYYGSDFLGEEVIQERMRKLKVIADTLEKRNKQLILIFAPGKATFYPEYIPDHLQKEKNTTNYERHVEWAKTLHLDAIDFQAYFLSLKNKTEYSLYPKYGIHWSYYGATLVNDSIISFIEKKRNIAMLHPSIQRMEVNRSRDTDYDIGASLNVLKRLDDDTTAVPILKWPDDVNVEKPKVVVVSDSFYWVLQYQGISSAFGKNQFWYYYHDIYPATSQGFQTHEKMDLAEEIENHDVFIILGTDATLPAYGWGFIEEAYELFQK